jgi:hypothetical protein
VHSTLGIDVKQELRIEGDRTMTRERQWQFGTGVSVLAVLLCVLAVTPAVAGPNETTDLVAMYAHIPFAAGAATGPFSTVFYMANGTATIINVNVKCYNDVIQRVGPAAGVTFNLAAFDIDVATPVNLQLTSAPNFTGLGFCYFARTSGDDFAVTFAMGIQGNNPGLFALHPLFSSNASMALGASTAQAMVSADDSNVPLWLGGASWSTFLVLVGPTASSVGNVRTDIYNTGGSLLGTQTRNIAGRDVEFYVLSAVGGSHGMADITRTSAGATRGYMGWVYSVNSANFEGILYDLALDKDDVSPLVAADRP